MGDSGQNNTSSLKLTTRWSRVLQTVRKQKNKLRNSGENLHTSQIFIKTTAHDTTTLTTTTEKYATIARNQRQHHVTRGRMGIGQSHVTRGRLGIGQSHVTRGRRGIGQSHVTRGRMGIGQSHVTRGRMGIGQSHVTRGRLGIGQGHSFKAALVEGAGLFYTFHFHICLNGGGSAELKRGINTS
ncbi:hypothetical protein NQD34_002957 [Periophthalmus magnuspinnatus]|nr:hypothetical protein NQD34_002957 [Periophthalmus magnuspinnatus]